MNVTYRFWTILTVATCMLAFSSTKARAVFSTGFEEPTYVSGSLDGQDSWSSTDSDPPPRVQTASEIATELTDAGLNPADPVHGGSQAVIVTSMNTTGSSDSTAAIRPISGLESATNVTLDVWARPLTQGSAGSTVGDNLGNIFMTMEDSGGTRAAAFRFGAVVDEGQLVSTSIDYASADMAGLWVPSGTSWEADTWYNLRIEADYASTTYDFFINGTKANDDPITFYSTASTGLSQIRIFRGSGQAGMIIDDLSVVPEPASLGLLLVAGGTMLFYRRAPAVFAVLGGGIR